MDTKILNTKDLNNNELLGFNGGAIDPLAGAAAVTIIFRAGYDFGYGLVKYLID